MIEKYCTRNVVFGIGIISIGYTACVGVLNALETHRVARLMLDGMQCIAAGVDKHEAEIQKLMEEIAKLKEAK